MGHIKVGVKIPNIELKNHNDKMIKLEDINEKILLSWHPLAWTDICAKQMQDLDYRFDDFRNLGILPFGLSVDHVPCKAAWAEKLELDNLQLLCDFWPHGEIAQELGIFHDTMGISGRINILVNEKREVIYVKKHQIKEQPDFDEILKDIKNL